MRKRGHGCCPYCYPSGCRCYRALVIEDEDGGSGKPLPVELAPYSLAPTGIGYGKMDGILVEIMPIYTRGQMTEGIDAGGQVLLSEHRHFHRQFWI